MKKIIKEEDVIPAAKELDAFQLVMKMCEKANEEGYLVEFDSLNFSIRDKTLVIRPVQLLKQLKRYITRIGTNL